MAAAYALAEIETNTHTENDVRAIAVQASRNDSAAFARLYRMYFSQVFTFINFRVSTREDAEDLTSAVFEKALAAIDRYQPQPAQFSTWLYTIARNCVIDHYRRRRLPVDDEAETAVIPATDCGAEPETVILTEERRRTLRESLRILTDEQREVIECRFFFELSIKETACLLHRTEGAIKALQFRALANLQHLLNENMQII